MPQDETPSPDQPAETTPADDTPEIEDAYAPPDAADDKVPADDEADLLEESARSLDAEPGQADELDEETVATTAVRSAEAAERDDTGDADSIPDEPTPASQELEGQKPTVWDRERSPHKIAVELKRIESEIRGVLEGRDPKRKRKLGGTRRWLELQEDIVSWRHTGRFDESTLNRLQELTARRHYLFRRLCFLATTRGTWNT